MTVRFEGWFINSEREKFKEKLRKGLSDAVKKQLQESFKDVKKSLENDVRSNFKVKKQSFAKAFGKKIYDKRTDRLPAMSVYAKLSKIMDGFEGGVTIKPKRNWLFIPTIRIGPKRFKNVLETLHRTNTLFYKAKGGRMLCLARVTKTNKQVLTKFKKQQRIVTGVKAIRINDEVLIAVMKKKVTLKKKLHLHEILNSYTGEISNKSLERFKNTSSLL